MQPRYFLAMIVCALLVVPASARAQEFGVMESAETIDRGTFKLRVNPMFVLGKDGQDGEAGVAAQLGYGFTDRFDTEVGVALYDGIRFLGVNGEYRLLRDAEFDLAVIGGVHIATGDRTPDTRSFDLTFLGSGQVADRLEFYAGLDFAFKSLTSPGADFSYRTVHLVPGIEYRLAADLDFVGEFGIGLNNDSWNYVSAGLAIYFR